MLAFHGELDLARAEAALGAIAFADRDGGTVVIDLAQLTFIDAAGLRALVAAHRLLRQRLTFSPGRGIVARALELTGLDTALPFAPTPRCAAARPDVSCSNAASASTP